MTWSQRTGPLPSAPDRPLWTGILLSQTLWCFSATNGFWAWSVRIRGRRVGQTRPVLRLKLERSVLEITKNPSSSGKHGSFQEEPWGSEISEVLFSWPCPRLHAISEGRGERGRRRHANSYGCSGWRRKDWLLCRLCSLAIHFILSPPVGGR